MKAPQQSNQCDCSQFLNGLVLAYLVFSLSWLMVPVALLLGLIWLGCSIFDGYRAHQSKKAELAEKQRRHERAERKWAEWRRDRNRD